MFCPWTPQGSGPEPVPGVSDLHSRPVRGLRGVNSRHSFAELAPRVLKKGPASSHNYVSLHDSTNPDMFDLSSASISFSFSKLTEIAGESWEEQ